jgi:hypothetical protein
MAFTLTQYSAICEAIAMGELVVQYDGKKVQYRSMDELMKAKALIETDLIAQGLLAAPATAAGVQRGDTTFASYCPD